jgi:hypothetical protein
MVYKGVLGARKNIEKNFKFFKFLRMGAHLFGSSVFGK